MRLGSVDISKRIAIVAEIGNNHEGDYAIAEALVHRAAEAQADVVKFQVYVPEKFVSTDDPRRLERLTRFALPHDAYARLAELARTLGLAVLATPLDLDSLGAVESFADGIKIASGDNNFFPLMQEACRSGLPVVLSAGAASLGDIRYAKELIQRTWAQSDVEQQIAVLHCLSCYPAPPEQLHLAVIPILARELGCQVGYSDHSVGTVACRIAAALGARIIEKHFTLDRAQSDYVDHRISAEPTELAELVAAIRAIEVMRGDEEKAVRECERSLMPAMRRSIAAARDLDRGHVIRYEDLLWLRPGGGASPGQEHRFLGRTLKQGVARGQRLEPANVE